MVFLELCKYNSPRSQVISASLFWLSSALPNYDVIWWIMMGPIAKQSNLKIPVHSKKIHSRPDQTNISINMSTSNASSRTCCSSQGGSPPRQSLCNAQSLGNFINSLRKYPVNIQLFNYSLLYIHMSFKVKPRPKAKTIMPVTISAPVVNPFQLPAGPAENVE
jgi:hypothetical protein